MRTNRVVIFTFLYMVMQMISFAKSPALLKSSVPEWIRQISLQPKAPNLEDISEGYYFELIDYQVDLASQTRYNKTVKVVTENAGAENAGQVHISFVPQYQQVILHELYLLRKGERLERLDLSKFELIAYETELSRSIYNGTYTAYLVLDDLRKDDKIVLSYSIKGFNPVFGGRFFDSFSLQGFEPTGALHINYVVPKNRKLNIKTFKNAPDPKKLDLGSRTCYYWEMPNTEHIPYDYNTPAWYPTRQRIECSEFEKWSDVAAWANDVNPIPPIETAGKLRDFMDQLWGKAKSDSMAYVKEVADFVQNEIRYMGIEVGEYSHRANTPDKVFSQRYGDCKDKSVLMAAMLKDKGINCRLILVNSWEQYNLENLLPSPAAFNHMVVYFSVKDRGQYIDPTITNQGGDIRNRYFPFYGKVLHVQHGGKIYDTEKALSGKTRIEERFHINKDGSAALNVLTVYTGSNADNTRSNIKQVAKNQIEKSNLEYYQRLYKEVEKKAPLDIEDDEVNNIIRIKESYVVPKLIVLDQATKRMAVYTYASDLSANIPEVTQPRTNPISLNYPLTLEHDVYIINPEGLHIPNITESLFEARDSYYFGKNISTIRDTLKVAFRLGFYDSYVKEEHVQEFISDFTDLNSLFTSAIYMDNDGAVIGSNTHNKINWWSVLLFVVLLSVLVWITIKYYHNRAASSIIYLYENEEYNAIGGWLIFLALSLILSPIRMLITGFGPYLFNAQVWETIKYNNEVSTISMILLLGSEFLFNTLLFYLYIYCFYLLIKRRDIFPQTLLATLVLQIIGSIVIVILTESVLKNNIYSSYSELIKAIIFGLVWILYLLKSVRVKGTFQVKAKDKRTEAINYIED